MAEHFYLARQAILDNDGEVMGYELLYRDSDGSSTIDNPRHATASVLVNVLNQSGLKNIVGERLAFINVEDSFLRHDFIESIPSETFVFELTASSALDEITRESVERLYKKNYTFSLEVDSFKKIDTIRTLIPFLSYIKIDSSSFETEFLQPLIKEFRENKVSFIASKVEEKDTFALYREVGCSAYQGYFFAKPTIIKDKQLDAKQISVIKLCNIIQSGASISEIVEAFEESPSITLQLLQFINSGAFHFRSRIASIHQVITLLGRNALNQWLMLLLYSKNFNNNAKYQNPLIIMVKQRTEIMVNLMKMIKSGSSQSELGEAYFVGVISLMDTLMHVTLLDVLNEFNVDEEIKAALCDRSGFLGELYEVVLAIENFDINSIDNFVYKFKIDKKKFENMMLEVFANTTQMESSSTFA